jgi:type IV pilus assembly protein PilC
MPTYAYVALDSRGREAKGSLDGPAQNDVLQRLKEMGYYPTRVVQLHDDTAPGAARSRWRRREPGQGPPGLFDETRRWFRHRVGSRRLTTFTRQLATLVETGMPLLRGLRILEEQEEHKGLKAVIGEVRMSIEAGQTLSEALARHPGVFNRLYVNMIKAGEIGGVLDLVLRRLADFMEKAQKLRGRVTAALFYPVTVLVVAFGLLTTLLTFVVPRFQLVFQDLMPGGELPWFTQVVLGIAAVCRDRFLAGALAMTGAVIALAVFVRTTPGRFLLDRSKLAAPLLGAVVRKASVARFARTLGTLISSGVPILQALSIVRETAGNVVVGNALARVHERIKEGDPLAAPLKACGVFPALVVGMVDVGEQTGALPETLLKVADTYDDEVDNAVAALTSLIEPLLIVLLAVVVGSIVIALFLPLIALMSDGFGGPTGDGGGM